MPEIITYQVITGNYNWYHSPGVPFTIITYQVITGNYNPAGERETRLDIITYQVITGNYNLPIQQFFYI